MGVFVLFCADNSHKDCCQVSLHWAYKVWHSWRGELPRKDWDFVALCVYRKGRTLVAVFLCLRVQKRASRFHFRSHVFSGGGALEIRLGTGDMSSWFLMSDAGTTPAPETELSELVCLKSRNRKQNMNCTALLKLHWDTCWPSVSPRNYPDRACRTPSNSSMREPNRGHPASESLHVTEPEQAPQVTRHNRTKRLPIWRFTFAVENSANQSLWYPISCCRETKQVPTCLVLSRLTLDKSVLHKVALFGTPCLFIPTIVHAIYTLDGGNSTSVIGFWSRPIWGPQNTIFEGISEPQKVSSLKRSRYTY